VAFLRAELERRDEEVDRYQRIVAGLAQANANLSERVRELEAPPESRDTPRDGLGGYGQGRGTPGVAGASTAPLLVAAALWYRVTENSGGYSL
jgi:hypothetical protein